MSITSDKYKKEAERTPSSIMESISDDLSEKNNSSLNLKLYQ